MKTMLGHGMHPYLYVLHIRGNGCFWGVMTDMGWLPGVAKGCHGDQDGGVAYPETGIGL